MPGHFLIICWVTLTDSTEKSKKIVLQIHKNWTNRSNSQFGTMIFCCFYLFEKIISENPYLKAQTRIFANLELVLFTHWEKKEFWKTQINVNLNLGQEKWTFFEKFPYIHIHFVFRYHFFIRSNEKGSRTSKTWNDFAKTCVYLLDYFFYILLI